jgi:hypothetical protein
MIPRAAAVAGESRRQTDRTPPLAVHPLLTLQRQIGNRAVAATLVQRQLAVGAEHLDAVRSVTGQLKGAVTNDTLHRLRDVVADHQKSTDISQADARLTLILALSDFYLTQHAQDPDRRARAKRSAVDDVKQAALVERSQTAAQARYARDLYAQKTGPKSSPTRFGHAGGATWQTVTGGAKAVATGAPTKAYLGAGPQAIELAKTYGLTEAEILAVRTYTSQDFKYINPATANSDSWMKSNMQPKTAWPLPTATKDRQRRELFEEGALHGALSVSALSKLPSQKGTCYRGERITEAKLASLAEGTVQSRANLTSLSLDSAKSQEFANGASTTTPDSTVSVLWEVKVTDGKDIQALSVFGSTEREWLLLPGSQIRVDRIVEQKAGVAGTPAATKWVRVYARQIG